MLFDTKNTEIWKLKPFIKKKFHYSFIKKVGLSVFLQRRTSLEDDKIRKPQVYEAFVLLLQPPIWARAVFSEYSSLEFPITATQEIHSR